MDLQAQVAAHILILEALRHLYLLRRATVPLAQLVVSTSHILFVAFEHPSQLLGGQLGELGVADEAPHSLTYLCICFFERKKNPLALLCLFLPSWKQSAQSLEKH